MEAYTYIYPRSIHPFIYPHISPESHFKLFPRFRACLFLDKSAFHFQEWTFFYPSSYFDITNLFQMFFKQISMNGLQGLLMYSFFAGTHSFIHERLLDICTHNCPIKAFAPLFRTIHRYILY